MLDTISRNRNRKSILTLVLVLGIVVFSALMQTGCGLLRSNISISSELAYETESPYGVALVLMPDNPEEAELYLQEPDAEVEEHIVIDVADGTTIYNPLGKYMYHCEYLKDFQTLDHLVIRDCVSRNFVIIRYHDSTHWPRQENFDEHIADQLVYLNDETEQAEVVYETNGKSRILYGNEKYVLIWNESSNTYQYIDLASLEILQEVEAGLKMKWKRYYGVYDGISQIEIFDSNGDKKVITLDVNIENLK